MSDGSQPETVCPNVPPPRPGKPDLWAKVESFLDDKEIIPVIGPGVITFGADDRPLYPWLIDEVAKKLGISPVPDTFHRLVCEYLLKGNATATQVYLTVHNVLRSADIKPGPLLCSLASISQCRVFLTLGFDPLLEQALKYFRRGGLAVSPWVFSPFKPTTDMPEPKTSGTIMGYLFGKTSSSRDFLLWDADAIEFVLDLQRQLPAFNNLGKTLSEHNLLIMGASFPDWLIRFLVRVIRQKRLTDDTLKHLLLAETDPPSQNDAVVFYDTLRKDIKLYGGDAVAFVREFCRIAHDREPPLPPLPPLPSPGDVPPSEPEAPQGSIFISYCLDDADEAFEVVKVLRGEGCLVWIDDERLEAGERWDNDLEEAVRNCGFFVSLISRTTEKKRESYFHQERRWAAQRYRKMPEAAVFYFPVVADDTKWPFKQEPNEFSEIGPAFMKDKDGLQDLARQLAKLQKDLLAPPPHHES